MVCIVGGEYNDDNNKGCSNNAIFLLFVRVGKIDLREVEKIEAALSGCHGIWVF
jgi:hypothetical protein